MNRRLTAILVADVVGYSRLMGNNEAGTLAQLKEIRQAVVDAKIAEHGGRIVKVTGDGVLAEFPSVVNAVSCATEIQAAMRARTLESAIQFRIGVNLGDVIAEGDDIYGDGVNVAARLESVAQPGGIAVSQSVCDHVGNRLSVTFGDCGEQQLKNIEKPIRVYDVLLDEPTSVEMPATRRDKPSIAVLPFTNMSGDPEQEYFSDGITEDIITDLSEISALSVIARHTSFTYKEKAAKVQNVGQELGADFILEGSVRKAGARVRVTGQLVNSKDGTHIWAERFDRDLTDIFAIQDEITHAIVTQLKVKLLPQEKKSIGQAPTDNIEAYTYYVRGGIFCIGDRNTTAASPGKCLPKPSRWIRNMPAPTLGWPTAIRSFISITASGFRLMICSRRRTRRSVWMTLRLKRTPRVEWRSQLRAVTMKRKWNSKRRSR